MWLKDSWIILLFFSQKQSGHQYMGIKTLIHTWFITYIQTGEQNRIFFSLFKIYFFNEMSPELLLKFLYPELEEQFLQKD